MDKLRNTTLEALWPSHAQRSLNDASIVSRTTNYDASKMRVGFFKNVYRNVRKAYFDRRTTQSEFYFANNILCNQR